MGGGERVRGAAASGVVAAPRGHAAHPPAPSSCTRVRDVKSTAERPAPSDASTAALARASSASHATPPAASSATCVGSG